MANESEVVACCVECRDHLIQALAACLKECDAHGLGGQQPMQAIDWNALLQQLKPAAAAALKLLIDALLKS